MGSTNSLMQYAIKVPKMKIVLTISSKRSVTMQFKNPSMREKIGRKGNDGLWGIN
jgi:hypothetical protein